jgi:hypothetical protein
MNRQEAVRVYDLETKTITTIPAQELAPGMIRAKVEGIEGEVFIEAAQMGETPYRQPPFSEGIRKRLEEIRNTFVEVRPLSLEEWEDGFRRDTNPEKEVLV